MSKNTSDIIIESEIVAIMNALEEALQEQVYRKLREEAEDECLKLNFTVCVHFEQCAVAKMSGSIKLAAEGQSRVKNPNQMELDLEGGQA